MATEFFAAPYGEGDGLTAGTPASLSQVKLMAASTVGDVDVWLADGRYELTAPLEFGTADSGDSGTISWKAARDALPRFSGGRVVEGWTLHDAGKNIWKATTTETAVRAMYVDGVRATRVSSTGYSFVTANNGVSFASTDPSCPVFATPGDLELCFDSSPTFTIASWLHNRLGVLSASRVGDTTTLAMDFEVRNNLAYKTSGQVWNPSPTWIENAYEFLSASTKGQFSMSPGSGTIYYVPRDTEDMTSAEVIVPHLEQLLTVTSYIRNVSFQGIAWEHTAWNTPTSQHGYIDPGGPNYCDRDTSWSYKVIPSGISLLNVLSVNFTRNVFRHMSGCGIGVWGATGLTFQSNIIHDIGAEGIYIAPVDWGPGTTDNISVRSNYVHDIGLEYRKRGIELYNGNDAHVIHNHVERTPYTGIGCYPNDTNSKKCEVGWNRIIDAMQHLDDGAILYTWGTICPTLTGADRHTLHDNYLTISRTPGPPPYHANGMYLDGDSDSFDVTANVIVSSLTTWMYTQVNSANNVASGNWATAGLISEIYGSNTISAPTDITGTNPAGWPAGAQAVYNASGLDAQDSDLLTYATGPLVDNPTAPVVSSGDTLVYERARASDSMACRNSTSDSGLCFVTRSGLRYYATTDGPFRLQHGAGLGMFLNAADAPVRVMINGEKWGVY